MGKRSNVVVVEIGKDGFDVTRRPNNVEVHVRNYDIFEDAEEGDILPLSEDGCGIIERDEDGELFAHYTFPSSVINTSEADTLGVDN